MKVSIVEQQTLQDVTQLLWTESPSPSGFLEQVALATVQAKELAWQEVIAPELLREHLRMERIAQHKGFSLPFMGAGLTLNEPYLHEGSESDVAVMPLHMDPFYVHNHHKMVLPKTVKHHLDRLNKEGIDFHELYIAHELPKGITKQHQVVPLAYFAPPIPFYKQVRLKNLSAVSQVYWTVLGTAVMAVSVGAALAATSVVGLPMLMASAAVGLDPVLIGVNIDRSQSFHGHHPCLYYPIAQWTW